MKLLANRTIRTIVWFSIAGGILPLVIFTTSFVPAISDFWWWHKLIIVLWPTFLLMMGFSGPVDSGTLTVLIVSALLNAVVYAICVSIVAGLFLLVRRLWSKRIHAQ